MSDVSFSSPYVVNDGSEYPGRIQMAMNEMNCRERESSKKKKKKRMQNLNLTHQSFYVASILQILLPWDCRYLAVGSTSVEEGAFAQLQLSFFAFVRARWTDDERWRF